MEQIIVGIFDTALLITVSEDAVWANLGFPFVSKIVIKIGRRRLSTGYAFARKTKAEAFAASRGVIAQRWFFNHPYVQSVVAKLPNSQREVVRYVCTNLIS